MKRIDHARAYWAGQQWHESAEEFCRGLLKTQGLDPFEELPDASSPEQIDHEVHLPVTSWSGFVAQPDPALKAEALRLCAKFVDHGFSHELTVEHLLLTARLCGVTAEQIREVSK